MTFAEIIVTTHCPDMERFIHMSYSIRSLLETTPPYAKVIIYDNSANEGLTDSRGHNMSRAFFKRLTRDYSFEYRPLEKNEGMATPKNLALLLCQTPLIFFTDNDIMYKHGWVDVVTDMLTPRNLVSPLGANPKYHVEGTQYTKVSPGVFGIYTDNCPRWEDTNIPGRSFQRTLRTYGVEFHVTPKPMALHVGAGQTTWHED